MATEAQARLVWEVWRLTHEIAGGTPPTWEALPGNVRLWFAGVAMRSLSNESLPVEVIHRAVMDSGLPEGSPFTVSDVQPFILLPAVTRAAWSAMAAVAFETKNITPHAAGAFAA
jgi:hypothetical protein